MDDASGLQLRSRITVVCAECKRLKLKCDRRNPCGSCTKRNTTSRCVYSTAAAERVDLQSLNNRLLVVESRISSLVLPSTPLSSSTSSSSAALPDRLIATGFSGSSVAVSCDDVSSLYLLELGIISQKQLSSPASSPPVPPTTQAGAATTRPEEQVRLVYPSPPSTAAPPIAMPSLSAHLLSLLPPVSALDPLETVLKLHPTGVNFRHFRQRVVNMFAHFTSDPTATTVSDTRKAVVRLEEHTMSFYATAASAFALAALVSDQAVEGGDDDDLDGDKGVKEIEDTADEEGQSHSLASVSPFLFSTEMESKTSNDPVQSLTKPSKLHRLAVHARAAFEQAVKAGGNGGMYDLDYLVSGFFCILWSLFGGGLKRRGSEGRGFGCLSVSGAVYAEVGKMVNVARLMGLGFDPDESPGRWTLFEAEMRRRVWWDVVFYDSFVSDVMGQLPTLVEGTYSTRIPADVDECVFDPGATYLPLAGTSVVDPIGKSGAMVMIDDDERWHENGFKYFELKCRLAVLVKVVKSGIGGEGNSAYTIEHAAQLEAEVTKWLLALPAPFRISVSDSVGTTATTTSDDSSLVRGKDPSSLSPILIAQRFELATTAHRLIFKIYLPFIKMGRRGNVGAHEILHQAFFGTINAAHTIINASRALYNSWKTPRQHTITTTNLVEPSALFGFYSFGRSLFNSAVVCTYAVIRQPTAVWVKTALEGVESVLEMLRDPAVDGPGSEAIRVIEIMKVRGCEPSIGMKRSFDQIGDANGSRGKSSGRQEDGQQEDGRKVGGSGSGSLTHLPYVGPSVRLNDVYRAPGSPAPVHQAESLTQMAPRSSPQTVAAAMTKTTVKTHAHGNRRPSTAPTQGTEGRRFELPLARMPSRTAIRTRSDGEKITGVVKHLKRRQSDGFPDRSIALPKDATSTVHPSTSTAISASVAPTAVNLASVDSFEELRIPAPILPVPISTLTSRTPPISGVRQHHVSPSMHQDTRIQPSMASHEQQYPESLVGRNVNVNASQHQTQRFISPRPFKHSPQQNYETPVAAASGGYGSLAGSRLKALGTYPTSTASAPATAPASPYMRPSSSAHSENPMHELRNTLSSVTPMLPSQSVSSVGPHAFGHMPVNANPQSYYASTTEYESNRYDSNTLASLGVLGSTSESRSASTDANVVASDSVFGTPPHDARQPEGHGHIDQHPSPHTIQMLLEQWPAVNPEGEEFWSGNYPFYSQ